jgi:Fic family protein
MELLLPDQIVLNEASKALIGDVEETARRVNEYRPLPEEVTKRILDDLLGERVYASNAIEGNTLDLRETATILKSGRILENRRREATEARNLGEAVNAVSDLVKIGETARTVEHLRQVHRLILRETPDEYWGGRFREQGVIIEGAKYQPPDHTLVPTLVDRVMEHLRRGYEGISPLLMACWAHWSLARIHPFKDGNGRISRLWQDLILFQANLTAAIIRPEERRDYLDALTAADEGDFNRLFQMTAQRVLTTFDKYLAVIAQDKELDAFAKEIAGEADARLAEKRTLRFQKWARKFEQLRWEFEICSGRITSQRGRVRIQFRPYNTIDQPKWETIAESGSANQTWFFTLQFDTEARHLRYVFFFLKHYVTDHDDEVERSENRVCLLIGEADSPAKTNERLDRIPGCPITLREVFLVDDSFVVRCASPATGETTYERGVSPMRIAQDFIREVVLRRLT